jgi:hypothetical protein
MQPGNDVSRKPQPTESEKIVRKMQRAVRSAEQAHLNKLRRTVKDEVSDAGTGQTIIRLRASPVESLIDRGKIGSEEQMAADEISKVFMAISGALFPRGVSLERVDKSLAPPDPPSMIDAQARYRAFAAHWSDMAKKKHPLLAIMIEAIFDERPFRTIDQERGMRSGKAEKVVIAGLRDYAARAGWVTGRVRAAWLLEASSLFRLTRETGE